MSNPDAHLDAELVAKLEQACIARLDVLLPLTEPPPPPTGEQIMANIHTAMQAMLDVPYVAPEPVKLTRTQIDSLKAHSESQRSFGTPMDHLTGAPIIEVDTVEESTPYLERSKRHMGFGFYSDLDTHPFGVTREVDVIF